MMARLRSCETQLHQLKTEEKARESEEASLRGVLRDQQVALDGVSTRIRNEEALLAEKKAGLESQLEVIATEQRAVEAMGLAMAREMEHIDEDARKLETVVMDKAGELTRLEGSLVETAERNDDHRRKVEVRKRELQAARLHAQQMRSEQRVVMERFEVDRRNLTLEASELKDRIYRAEKLRERLHTSGDGMLPKMAALEEESAALREQEVGLLSECGQLAARLEELELWRRQCRHWLDSMAQLQGDTEDDVADVLGALVSEHESVQQRLGQLHGTLDGALEGVLEAAAMPVGSVMKPSTARSGRSVRSGRTVQRPVSTASTVSALAPPPLRRVVFS
jgi:chromosome segregation ATPase